MNRARLVKRQSIIVITDAQQQDQANDALPSRETLLQWREGLLLQLRAIERILWPDTKTVETQANKR